MFVSVAVPNQEAILDFDRPAIPLLISEPILFQQTAQRAWMIIHAHYAASIDCGRFIWDAPLGQPATLRELNPATAPGIPGQLRLRDKNGRLYARAGQTKPESESLL